MFYILRHDGILAKGITQGDCILNFSAVPPDAKASGYQTTPRKRGFKPVLTGVVI